MALCGLFWKSALGRPGLDFFGVEERDQCCEIPSAAFSTMCWHHQGNDQVAIGPPCQKYRHIDPEMDRVPVDSEMGTPRSRHGDVQNCSSFCLVSVGKSMGGSDLSWIPKPVKTQIPQWSHEGPGIFVFFELTFFLKWEIPKTNRFNTNRFGGFPPFFRVQRPCGV